jgi:LemA protein
MYMLIFLAVVVLLSLWAVATYNKGVKLRNLVEEAWSGISVQLKRRYDLIPNLVSTVKGYAKHEQDTLEKVINLRNQAQAVPSDNVEAQARAEQQLSAGIRGIFALAENYPDLKANTNFMELQRSLADIEDHIQNARRYYNAIVRDNNNFVETFPSMIIARMGGFNTYSYFEIDEQERENVKVEF